MIRPIRQQDGEVLPRRFVRLPRSEGAVDIEVGRCPSGRSARLRPEPCFASRPKVAATIVGALLDWRGLLVGLVAILFVIFAFGAVA